MSTLRDNRGPLQAVPAGHPMTAPTLHCDGTAAAIYFLFSSRLLQANIVYTHIYRAWGGAHGVD